VLAAAEITRHSQRLALLVDHDDRVGSVFMALAAMIFD
jgi:hypothetical protein